MYVQLSMVADVHILRHAVASQQMLLCVRSYWQFLIVVHLLSLESPSALVIDVFDSATCMAPPRHEGNNWPLSPKMIILIRHGYMKIHSNALLISSDSNG